MCGIAGIVSWGDGRPPTTEEMASMTAALSHRGPDQAGIYVDSCAALGHARLSVIDLETGIQPLANENDTLWITYNGEVYNYPELRQDLISYGHRFKTRTDTEVVLHLLEQYGPAGLDRLNGQYALAVWDSGKQQLFLARDPFGVRPLYYFIFKGRFVFASEIKAILSIAEEPASLDPFAWDDLFTFWTLLPGRTCFDGIHELPPGHFIRADAQNVTVERYWRIDFTSSSEPFNGKLSDAADCLEELITDAVRIRLRADVPVGCYLSGGLDSTAVSAITSEVSCRAPMTFGLVFEDDTYDESAFQRYAVEFLKTNHFQRNITAGEIARAFSDVVWHCEQPLLRTAPIPLFLLSEKTRATGLKVVLTGEGADEIFAGYHLFKEMKIRRFWSEQPDSEWRPRLLERLYPYVLDDTRLYHHLKSFFARHRDNLVDPFYSHCLRWANIARMKRLFSDNLLAATRDRDAISELADDLPASFFRWQPLEQAQYLEMVLFMSQYLLSCQGDRVAMAHGVEIRLPFLDPRVVSFMAGIPPHWKMRGLKEKALLRKALSERLPKRILERPKHPYRAPVPEPLLSLGSASQLEALEPGPIRRTGLFKAEKVARLRDKLWRSGKIGEMEGMALCAIVSSQVLHDRFVANPLRPTGSFQSPITVIDRRNKTE